MSCITKETIEWFAKDFNLSIKEEGQTLEMDAYTMPRLGCENYIADLVREYLAPYSGTIDRIETLKCNLDDEEATGLMVYVGDTMVLKVAPWSWSEGELPTDIGVEVEIWPIVKQATGSKRLADAFEKIAWLNEPYILFRDGQSWSIRRAF